MTTFERLNVASSGWDAPEKACLANLANIPAREAVFASINDMVQSGRPEDCHEMAWHVLVTDLRAVSEHWMDVALGHGWTLADLFGSAPRGRSGIMGLALVLKGRPIESIDPDRIVIANRLGPPNVIYRQSPGCSAPFARETTLIWDSLLEAAE